MTIMHTKTTAAAVVLAGALLFASPAPAKPPRTGVACGQTIYHSVRLTSNLTNCPGDGLVIGADGITVDLNGHTIDGTVAQGTPECVRTPGARGINNAAGHDALTIKDGTVQQFSNGFDAGSGTTGMADSHLHDLTVRDNRFSGISLGSGQRLNNNNRIERNVVSGNGCGEGIALNNAHGNRVARNRIENNLHGMLICCSDHNVVEHNTVSGNQDTGIIVCCEPDSYNVIQHNAIADNGGLGIILCCQEGDQHNRIAHNRLSGNGIAGIVLEGADANQISHNRVLHNGVGVIVHGNRNTVTDNEVADAVGCPDRACGFGILLEGGTGNVIARNEVRRTLLDGIRIAAFDPGLPTVDTVVRDNRVREATVDGFSVSIEGEGTVSGTRFERNLASRSGDDGFDIRSTATTLTSNLAVRNGDLGIEALTGVTDGGGNRARANGDPEQCNGVACNR